MKTLLAFLCLLTLPLMGQTVQPPSGPPTVTLAWESSPEPDIAGYFVYIGKVSPGTYEQRVLLGKVNSYTFAVTPNEKWYFVITAFNLAGLESLPSNELSYLEMRKRPSVPGNVTITADNASVTVTLKNAPTGP